MNRVPNWILLTVAVVVILFSLPGVIFANHTSAKIFYGVLIVLAAGALVIGLRRRTQLSN